MRVGTNGETTGTSKRFAEMTLMLDVSPHVEKDYVDSEIPIRIALPYLLVVGQQLPLFRDESGQLFADELWQKDLSMHLNYLDHLMIASPCLKQTPPPHTKPLSIDKSTVELIELPQQKSFLHFLAVMPSIVFRLCKAVSRAGIVHSAIVGWPIPMGWLVTPLILIFRKPLVIVVESATWRLQDGTRAGWKRRLRALVQECMGQWVLRKAALVICTQDEYRRSLLGPKRAHGFVIPASWIDKKDILSKQAAEEHWRKKLSVSDSRLRILFVGRLAHDKGILILLEAMRQLDIDCLPITLGVVGDGVLKSQCESIASKLNGTTKVSLLGTVRYGEPLFAVIRSYDAVVVPSIGDEQPRIVFDAYSQAVPVLGSDTPGLRSCVKSGDRYLLAPPNDVPALVALLRYAAENRLELKRLGLECLAHAESMTHQEMHRQRANLLQRMLDERTQSRPVSNPS
jgi:glycosyltransferase involved in cell wall biosynthesis